MKHELFKASLILVLTSALCQSAMSKSDAGKAPKEKDLNDTRFQKQMLDVAADYYKYQKYDENLRPADGRCAFSWPSGPKLSKSKDAGTHGHKLYYVYAKDLASYINNQKAPDDQVLVKESFLPSVPLAGDPDTKPSLDEQGEYKVGKKYGLFIMMRLKPGSPGYEDTDDGWIYGTVTADGKTVTSAGKVQSCMGCHLQAPHGRLFGVPKTTPQATPQRP